MFFHIWFLTKYRRPVLDEETEQRLLAITQEIAQRKGYKILEIGPNRDHIHILLELDQREKLPSVVRTLKAVTAKKIREKTPHLRVGNGYHTRECVEERNVARCSNFVKVAENGSDNRIYQTVNER